MKYNIFFYSCIIIFITSTLLIQYKLMRKLLKNEAHIQHLLSLTIPADNSTSNLKQILIKNDVSMEDSQICNFNIKSNVWLISYAAGLETHLANQRALTVSAVNKCIDFIKPYNDRHIAEAFLRENSKILSLERGAGYWLWKPYIILKTLNEIPEGDIVLYVDSGMKIISKVDKLINSLDDKDILIFYNAHTNRQFVKRDLYRIMDMDNEDVRDAQQIDAAYMVIINNSKSRQIIGEWLELCKNEKALTDLPSTEEYTEFIEHRHDQAILSLIALKNKDNFKILPNKQRGQYFYHHRRRSKKEGSLLFIE